MEETDAETVPFPQEDYLQFEVDDTAMDEPEEEANLPQANPADYTHSPPARSQPATLPEDANSRPSSKEAAATRERPKISWQQWNDRNAGRAQEEQEERDSSRHRESSRHRDSSRRRESSRHRASSDHWESDHAKDRPSSRDKPSRQQEPAKIGRTSSRHQSPGYKEASRQPEQSDDRGHDGYRRDVRLADPRREAVAPKFLETDRRGRSSQAARSPARRSRSPLRRTISQRPRSPPSARHMGAYDQTHMPVQPTHAPRMPHHHPPASSAWPELWGPQSRPHAPLIKPSQMRAPLRSTVPQAAWEDTHYERDPYGSYPQAVMPEQRFRQPGYRELAPRDDGYRVPVYRESEYAEAGYAAPSARSQEYQQQGYDYDREPYRGYAVDRTEVEHDPYGFEQAWDAPRHPEPLRQYPFKESHSELDGRYVESHHERADMHLPARTNMHGMHASTSFSRQGSYHDDQQLSRQNGHMSSSRGPQHQAPRHAPRAVQPAAPAPRAYRRGGQDSSAVHQDSRAVPPRYDSDYAPAPIRYREVHEHPTAHPIRVERLALPHHRSTHRGSRSVDVKHREPRRDPSSHRRSDRSVDRSADQRRHHVDRRDNGEQAAHHRSDRSAGRSTDQRQHHVDRRDNGEQPADDIQRRKAAKANTQEAKPKHVADENIDKTELPGPPPGRQPSAKNLSPQKSRPAVRSEVVQPDLKLPAVKDKGNSGDSSPELNVAQGFLTAPSQSAATNRSASPSHARRRPAAAGALDSSKAVEGTDRKAASKAFTGKADLIEAKDQAVNRSSLDKGSRHRDAAEKPIKPDSQDRSKVIARKEPSKADGQDHREVTARKKAPSGDTDGHRFGSRASGTDKGKSVGSRTAGELTSSSSRAEPKSGDSRHSSKQEGVQEKQAGVKRRSKSPEQIRSPKRKALAASDSGQAVQEKALELDLPPPPMRPPTAPNGLPMPPARPSSAHQPGSTGGSKLLEASLMNEADLPLPPALPLPPPKPAPKDQAASRGKETSDKAKVETQPRPSGRNVQSNKPDKDTASTGAAAESKTEGQPAKQSGLSKSNSKAGGKVMGKADTHSRSAATAEKAQNRADKPASKPSGGRTGQKRSRSRSPEQDRHGRSNANGVGGRDKYARTGQRQDVKQGTLQNGQRAEPERRLIKEWMYQDKKETHGPYSLRRLKEMFDNIKARKERRKTDAFLRNPVWRQTSRKGKQVIDDVVWD